MKYVLIVVAIIFAAYIINDDANLKQDCENRGGTMIHSDFGCNLPSLTK